MRRLKTTQLEIILQGAIVGIIAGGVVSGFRWAIATGLTFVRAGYQHFSWPRLGLVVMVSALTVWLLSRLLTREPGISGSGIPQVEGQLQGELDYSWWSVLWRKFVGGILAIAPGLFLGREGPSIQLGAAVGQGFAEIGHAPARRRRIMIASGAAAGLSAAFNAPIAGTLFVLEEVYHNFSPVIWLSGLTSALTANFVSAYIFGQTPVLHLIYAHSLPLNLYWHLLVLGVILGLMGRLYQSVLLAMPKAYQQLHLPQRFWGIVPFLLMIPLGFWRPALLGGGNAIIVSFNAAIPSIAVLAGMLIIRFVFSMVAYGSGLPGGIFLPILSLGAIIGALYGQIMVAWHWLPQTYVINLIIFSMAAYFAAIGKAPFTAILLVTEMVGSLRHLMPMAVLSLVAYAIVDVLRGAPIYESLLKRLLPAAPDDGPMQQVDLTVFAGTKLAESLVGAVSWPAQTLLIRIQRGEQMLVPNGQTKIQAGDLLRFQTRPNQVRQLRQLVNRPAEDGQDGPRV
ncbi:chloride channel protein [Lacticaseibacillus brantae DSM 23927]|uniref:Chloride channel protein n=2 Tax=Lacticaseibacillus brantae TaxID=943673 RepID=A0A0R2B7E1_9LACO|nr:ClC family H(+)/Cl(-) exchange transporter [Lacticaseibacillus brantae]KRM72379.1 chloride channel protein [Lacticaseibacillus brantae DSM 23927]